MPHGACFLWQSNVLALHVVSDALIAAAYFSIPFVLVQLVRRRRDIPFSGVFWAFSIFIVSCGLTHVFSIVVIWTPLYWAEGAIKALTALSSVATAIMLVPLLPRALSLKTPAQLEALNESLRNTMIERERLLAQYEREHHIAVTLQTASLAEVPASIGALEIAAVYQPGVGDLEIGGDWYDAFALPDGRVIVSIGDVAGKGLHASVVMAKVRQAIRVAAHVRILPGEILDAADRALKLEYPDHVVTAFVGIIDDTDSVLTFASAGHPSPFLREPDGTIVELRSYGLPLGLRQRDEAMQAESVPLVPGSLFTLYTDGLIEASHDNAAGERRLLEVLSRQAIALAENPARELQEAVLVDGSRDDVAILTVRVGTDRAAGARWVFDVRDERAAHEARRALALLLRERGADEDECFCAELTYGELVGNVARHAGGSVDVRLDWHTGSPVLHVLDDGPGFQRAPGLPIDMMSESGRGLFIVQQVTSDFTILRRPHGGTHARAAISIARPRAVACDASLATTNV